MEAKKPKEKPVEKTPIPGTNFIRVVTNLGNVFWNDKETKKSHWTMPAEIAEAVAEWEAAKYAVKDDAMYEVERVKAEVETELANKRKAEEEVESKKTKKKPKTEKPKDTVEDEVKSGDDDEPPEGDEEKEQRKELEALDGSSEGSDEESESAPREESKDPPATPIPTLSLQESKVLFRVRLLQTSPNSITHSCIFPDASRRKRHQPPPPMGHLPTPNHQRPALHSTPFRLPPPRSLR